MELPEEFNEIIKNPINNTFAFILGQLSQLHNVELLRKYVNFLLDEVLPLSLLYESDIDKLKDKMRRDIGE